jgi:DNA-binding PadR family transcriptional regulator
MARSRSDVGRFFRHGELHLVLLALLEGKPMHGYELMGELRRLMGRRYRSSPGSIYPAVAALESGGLIEATEDGERRTYSLTSEGSKALEQRADRLASLESRMGVHFSKGVEPELARFSERVRAVAPRIPEEVLTGALDVAAQQIERLAAR